MIQFLVGILTFIIGLWIVRRAIRYQHRQQSDSIDSARLESVIRTEATRLQVSFLELRKHYLRLESRVMDNHIAVNRVLESGPYPATTAPEPASAVEQKQNSNSPVQAQNGDVVWEELNSQIVTDALNREERAKAAARAALRYAGHNETQIEKIMLQIDNDPS